MKKLVIALLTATLFFCATSVMATSFYYQADYVVGVGTVTYDVDEVVLPYAGSFMVPGNGAPTFTLLAYEGLVDTNMDDFVAGNYTVDFALSGFSVGGFDLPDFSFSLGAYDIAGLSLSGDQSGLTWEFDPYAGITLSYDAGSSLNLMANTFLLNLDPNDNGIMDANISWDTLRVELTDTAPVPEPSTLLLLGAGIAGLAAYRRKKS